MKRKEEYWDRRGEAEFNMTKSVTRIEILITFQLKIKTTVEEEIIRICLMLFLEEVLRVNGELLPMGFVHLNDSKV
jgi:hypothetical protein